MSIETQAEISASSIYAEVILPLPFALTFTYHIPEPMRRAVLPGMRVIVPFGRNKVYAGIVDALHDKPSLHYDAKDILDLPDQLPVFQRVQLDFMWWLSNYYLCTIGEVLQTAMPAGFKVSTESLVQLNPDADMQILEEILPEREMHVLRHLRNAETLSYEDIAKITELKSPYPVIKKLLKADAILLLERIKDRYVPKTEKRIKFQSAYLVKTALNTLLDDLNKWEKQQEIILYLLQQLPVLRDERSNEQGVAKSQIKKRFSDSALKTLLKKDILIEYEQRLSRIPTLAEEDKQVILSAKQQEVRQLILDQLQSKEVVLLHGVTGSGKTEILVQMIRDVLESGHQVLFLLPEIALTTQLSARLQYFFGDKLGIYHSRYSDNERVEVWRGVRDGRFQVVVGVRSAIFLPFDDLGLVIVDEEHDASYKQYDPAPRYHGRDMAVVLARYHQCPVILSSATPSLESYFLAKEQKFGFVSLQERYGGVAMPEIRLVSQETVSLDEHQIWHFGEELRTAVEAALEAKKQVIVFQNRRGYAPYLQCASCNWIAKCSSCSVSLTFHQYSQELRCHYCGFKKPVVHQCDACHSTAIKQMGVGTQRIEEEAGLLFPTAVVQRMDQDTTRSREALETILERFSAGETDLLIGTQMVTKGLDFARVSLVGVIDADQMIHFPDFRAHERAFQMLSQVSGRAGRKAERGSVLIQTAEPKHPVLQRVIAHDYEGFYTEEIEERKNFSYPPFTRMVAVRVKAKDKLLSKYAIREIYEQCRLHLPEQVQIKQPHEPLVSKIRNQYIQEMMLFVDRSMPQKGWKSRLQKVVAQVKAQKPYQKIRIILDVDPV